MILLTNFSPSVIKGGLDESNSKKGEVDMPVLGNIAAGTHVEAIQMRSK